ncbi:metallophosphoesterase family protein [Caldalkalibacillus salinus]|uniref:metallophosphoesterase family protein n=1 Tax=Caldalkalibacillus salinus TaxID=2803787 RepID=UPI0019233026|nr:metallophosphoesterase [Caldalkalibacillus salinus]
MKALITSDTHGLKKDLKTLAEKVKVDKGFHCGDFCVDENMFPLNKMVLVKGNNDIRAGVPNDQVVNWAGLTFFVTHGHLYQVEFSLLNLKYKAQEAGADVVLFGHTHTPYCEREDGVIYMNPGSLRHPRGFSVPTFAILDVAEGEGAKTLSFTYYDHKGKKVPGLAKTFTL